MVIQTAADIAGGNAKVALGTAGQRARRLFLTSHTASSGAPARFGDVNVAAARGVELPLDVQVTISASDADPADSIDLSTSYVYVPSGTTVTFAWGI